MMAVLREWAWFLEGLRGRPLIEKRLGLASNLTT